MAHPEQYVIVGAGLAGVKAAEALRAERFSGSIVLLGTEPHLPYERPPLSKDYLLGEAERDTVFVHVPSWFDEHGVDVRRSTSAVSVDCDRREVSLSDGGTLTYDALLLAPGSTPRRLPVPGADLAGVHYLRTLDDSDALRAALEGAQRLAVIGGGWIGLEVAAVARTKGVEVTLVEQAPLPLHAVLGPEVAMVFADVHRSHGVDLRCGVGVNRMWGEAGRLAGVELADGTRIDADLAVVGVGVAPNIDLARDAGLEMGTGILVDEHLRSSDPAVFAAGDVAEAYHPLLQRHIRVEHWANALNQGAHAGRCMAGGVEPYDRLPYFFTDQYDLGMEYTGHVGPGEADRVVLRGDVADLRFMAFWLGQGRVLAGMHVNQWDTIEAIGDLVRSRRTVDPARLRDPGIALAEV